MPDKHMMLHGERIMLTRQDLIAALRADLLKPDRGRLAGHKLQIECETIGAISYRDVLEVLLWLSGARDWCWVDRSNRVSPHQPLVTSVLNLPRDILSWPALTIRYWNAISRIGASSAVRLLSHKGLSALYLRTDHWFGVQSGGSVGHVSGVINGLRSLGCYPHVISTDHLAGIEEDDHFHLCEPLYGIGRNFPDVPLLEYNGTLMRFVAERWGELSPSFIYQRYSLGNYVGPALKNRYGIPYVCEFNGPLTWVARHWEKRVMPNGRLLNRIELAHLHSANVLVVISQSLRDSLLARGIEADKILVNPNGVDPKQYSPEVDGTKVRQRYGLEGKTVIGFIGTFGLWHGADVLAEAFGHLLQQNPAYQDEIRLMMIGDGPTMPQVSNILAKFGVAESCVLTGLVPQREGPSYLAACDILTSPHVPNPDGSRFFGSPTKLFEYMAMGKGIVASDLEQIGQVLEHDRTAWLVPPGDPEALAHGLRTLVDDARRREQLGRAARREVVAHYTWEQHSRNIVDKLQERCGAIKI